MLFFCVILVYDNDYNITRTVPCGNAAMEETIKSPTREVAYLKAQLEWLKNQVFGQKPGKFVPTNEEQLCFEGFDELSEAAPEKKIIPAHERTKRKPTGKDKIVLPEDLPTERQVIDLPEEAKICSETGEPLVQIGEEITSKLAHKPGSYFIKQIVRPKYANPKRSENGLQAADLPGSLSNRCLADESLLADILVKKFGDHLPLYRQSEIMAREGIPISRRILCQWVLRAGVTLKPLYEELIKQILKSENVFYDETPVKMLAPGKGKTHQAYTWVLAGGKSSNPSYRIYDFQPNRCHHHAAKMLKGHREVLHSDKLRELQPDQWKAGNAH